MKDEIGRIFGMRIGGSSEGEAKRRAVKPGSEEWKNLPRPKAHCRLVGYIPLSPGQLKRGNGLGKVKSSDSTPERLAK